ncbi:MAG: DUF4340 domain-containing protein [Sediminispirochaetaceae bacterium]
MKRTVIYASIAVLLVLIFVIQETTDGRKNTLTVPKPPENIDMIVMEKDGNSIEMSGQAGTDSEDFSGWIIGPEEFPADKEKISGLVGSLRDVGAADVISTRESYDKFGLDGDTERLMRFFAEGREFLTLHLGNTASSGGSVYGRIDDRREVVLLPRDLADQFTLEVSKLREKQMASIPQDEIKRIVINSPGVEELLISRNGTEDPASDAELEWEARFAGADSAEDIESGRFRDFFIELADMRALSFLDKDPQGEPWADLDIFRQDGVRVNVSFWPPDDNGEFPVIVSTSPYRFTLPNWKARRLFLGIDSYFEAFED